MTKVVAIIQARMGSSRFPGKSLIWLDSATLIEHVINTCKNADLIDDIVVATTLQNEDNTICDHLKKMKVKVFRGSTQNVLDRYLKAAAETDADIIVRVTADDALKDPKLINKMIKFMKKNYEKYDLVTNSLQATFPEGQEIELIKFSVLKQISELELSEIDCEHVTSYIWNRPKKFKIFNFRSPINYSKYRLTLDTMDDFVFLSALMQKIKKRRSPQSIAKIIEGNPRLQRLHVYEERYKSYYEQIKGENNDKKNSKNEKEYVLDVLNSQFSSSSGSRYVNKLEKLAAEQYGVKYALAFNNGTATMHAALEAMGVREGDEVIVPL